MSEKVSVPRKLGASGRRLWRDVTGRWALRVDELRVLEDACRARDTLEKLEAAQDVADMYLRGSAGQLVLNGLFGEVRQQRAAFASLMGKLSLPDEVVVTAVSGVDSPRSVAARKAVAARWGKSA